MSKTATHRYIGITDDQDTCDHCGKAGLQRVVVLAMLDADGNVEEYARYGTTCAARALKVRGGARNVRDSATSAHRRTVEAATHAHERLTFWGADELNLDDLEAVAAFARRFRDHHWKIRGGGDGRNIAQWATSAVDCVIAWRTEIAEAALIGGRAP